MDKATLDTKVQEIIAGILTDEAAIKEVLDALGGDAFAKIALFPAVAQDVAKTYLGEKAFGEAIKNDKVEDITLSEAEIKANDDKLAIFAGGVDLSKPEYKAANDALDLLDYGSTLNARDNLIEAAKQQAYADCLTTKGLDEDKYKQSLINNVQMAVYEVALANSATAELPKAATHDVVMTFLATQAGKPKIPVSVDSLVAFFTKTSEQIEAKKESLLNKFAGSAVISAICTPWQAKLDTWDAKLTADYGTKYTTAKAVAKVLGKIGKGVAISAAMLAVASAGQVGFAVYAAYAVHKASKPLRDSYNKDPKGKAKGGSILGWMNNNKWEVTKWGLRSVGAVAAGISGYGMASGLGLIRPSTVISGGVAAVDVGVAAVKKKGMKQALFGLGASALAFAGGYLAHTFFGADAQKSDFKLPDGQSLDEANDGSMLVVNPDETKVDPHSDGSMLVVNPEETKVDPHSDALKSMLGDDCGCDDKNPENINLGKNCETKIGIQEKVGYNEADIKFWNSRIDQFMEPCDEKNLDILFESGKLDLKQFPGIETVEEFKYKLAIMDKFNMDNQKGLVEEIQEMMQKVQEAKCSGTMAEKLAALDKIEPMNNDFANDVADGMNSFDNRGNPLCVEAEKVNAPAQAPVDKTPKVEALDHNLDDNELKAPAMKGVDVPESTIGADLGAGQEEQPVGTQKTYSLKYQEEAQLAHDTPRKDYNGSEYVADVGPLPVHEIPLDHGGKLSYSFTEGAMKDMQVTGMVADERVQELAKRLEGFYENPLAQAMKLTAISEVYNDLEVRMEGGDKVHGVEEWMKVQKGVFEKFGMSLNEDNRLEVNEDFNKEKAIGAFQKDQTEYAEKMAKKAAKEAAKQQNLEDAATSGKDYNRFARGGREK